MKPFSYEKSVHRRTESPPEFPSYRRFKPYLRREFFRKCVYCCWPDFFDNTPTQYSFCVEHYRPKSKFPELETNYDNLFYACSNCNIRKSDYWPRVEEIAAGASIPNPCDDVMFDHLRFNGADVVTRSKQGEFTSDLLDLSDPEVVSKRELILTLVATLQRDRRAAAEEVEHLRAATSGGVYDEALCRRQFAEAKQQLSKLEEHLEALGALN